MSLLQDMNKISLHKVEETLAKAIKEGYNVSVTINGEFHLVEKMEKFARKCDVCGSLMNEGHVLNGGSHYFCTEKCCIKFFGKDVYEQYLSEYKEEEENGGSNDDFYWTSWEDEDDFCYYADGSEIEESE